MLNRRIVPLLKPVILFSDLALIAPFPKRLEICLLKPVILFSDLALIAPFPKRLEICLRKSPKKVEAIEIYEEKKT